MSVFVCSPDRLVRLRRDGGSWTAEPVLEGVRGQCVAADGARVLVGTRDRGAFVSADEVRDGRGDRRLHQLLLFALVDLEGAGRRAGAGVAADVLHGVA